MYPSSLAPRAVFRPAVALGARKWKTFPSVPLPGAAGLVAVVLARLEPWSQVGVRLVLVLPLSAGPPTPPMWACGGREREDSRSIPPVRAAPVAEGSVVVEPTAVVAAPELLWCRPETWFAHCQRCEGRETLKRSRSRPLLELCLLALRWGTRPVGRTSVQSCTFLC